MVLLKSRWPGKCRKCGVHHIAGDMVWWDKTTKGVTCAACHHKGGVPDEWVPPTNEEEDGLKVAKPNTLKVGHKLTMEIQRIPEMFGCSLHDHGKCNCPGCFVLRGGTTYNTVGRHRHLLVSVTVMSQLQRYGPGLFPSSSMEERVEHLRAYRPYYTLRFQFHQIGTETGTTIKTHVPLHYIRDGNNNSPYLKILPGAPSATEPTGLDAAVVYLSDDNGTGIEAWPRHQSLRIDGDRPIATHCVPITYANCGGLVGAKLGVVTHNGVALHGSAAQVGQHHASDHGCACPRCVGHEALSNNRSPGDTFRIARAATSTEGTILILIRTGPDGDYGGNVSIHVPVSMETDAIIATTGLAFSKLPDSLRRDHPDGQGIPAIPSDTPTNAEPRKEVPVVTDNLNLNEAATSLIAALQASSVPETRVREIALEMIGDELKKVPVKNHKIKFNDGAPIEFDGILHGMATDIAEAIVSGFHNIMVVGPAGSGKTFLFSQVAKILQKQMGWDESDYKASMSCAPGQTESMFIGRMIPSLTTGTESYHGTNLTRLYGKECGGAFLFDEISNSEPTVMNLVNSMIALDGHVTLPDGRILERPPKMVIFAADNTWGQGGDRLYIRNQLDAATLDRFTGAKFYMDYDEKLERAICPITEVYEAVSALRQKVTSLKLRRIVSTRAFAAAQRMGANGMKSKDILKRLTIDWSENDRKSVGA